MVFELHRAGGVNKVANAQRLKGSLSQSPQRSQRGKDRCQTSDVGSQEGMIRRNGWKKTCLAQRRQGAEKMMEKDESMNGGKEKSFSARISLITLLFPNKPDWPRPHAAGPKAVRETLCPLLFWTDIQVDMA